MSTTPNTVLVVTPSAVVSEPIVKVPTLVCVETGKDIPVPFGVDTANRFKSRLARESVTETVDGKAVSKDVLLAVGNVYGKSFRKGYNFTEILGLCKTGDAVTISYTKSEDTGFLKYLYVEIPPVSDGTKRNLNAGKVTAYFVFYSEKDAKTGELTGKRMLSKDFKGTFIFKSFDGKDVSVSAGKCIDEKLIDLKKGFRIGELGKVPFTVAVPVPVVAPVKEVKTKK